MILSGLPADAGRGAAVRDPPVGRTGARAFDDAPSRHDGYRLTSIVGALNQLVNDDITGSGPHMRDRTTG